MNIISVLPSEQLGKNFIPLEYLPKGKNEYYLRDEQTDLAKETWRRLRTGEIEQLVKNANFADDWENLLVSDEFDPSLIRNTEFHGLVRIGRMRNMTLEHHDLQLPVGITNSRIISCDIGDDAAIHHVRYLAHYIIGSRCILTNIDEMHTTNHAKFGNGIIKEGETKDVRIWLDIMNETGSRGVLPFDGMIPADAWLWAKYRDDDALQKRLVEITQNHADGRRGVYGTVGDQCVIKNSRILKDVKIGSHCYIKGINKLKNLTINSGEQEQTQIGEGVELVNGIIGYSCHVFYGCKAVRFIMGNNSNLKYGARLIHSILGANSTISCCEVLNALIFPAHEQHHNNSFLVAAVTMGQTNIAAGATIGSNHNSRANDNEIQAGRGFWPGLCTSLKHSSRFASFVLIAKGAYPAELDIPLPFALVNNNEAKGRLEIMPAFWWLYNMYALARNTWKYSTRDKRHTKLQNIEFDSLAPDTVEEMLIARDLLAKWTAKASLKNSGKADERISDADLIRQGESLLEADDGSIKNLTVLAEKVEKSRREAVVLNPHKGYKAYGQMLHYYAVKNLLEYREANPGKSLDQMQRALSGPRESKWINLGGQLIPEGLVDRLRQDIGSQKLKTWDDIHHRYDDLWEAYPLEKQRHAFAVLCRMIGKESLSPSDWNAALDKAVEIQEYVCDQVYLTRKKDYDNPFRQATYRNHDEMIAAIGTVEENSFIQQVRDETEEFRKRIEKIKEK